MVSAREMRQPSRRRRIKNEMYLQAPHAHSEIAAVMTEGNVYGAGLWSQGCKQAYTRSDAKWG